jgi:cytochrome c oxidase subunit 1
MLMRGADATFTYVIRFGVGLGLAALVVLVGRGSRGWLGRDGLGTAEWFWTGTVAWFAQGCYMSRLAPGRTMDFQVQDTYFVIEHFHVEMGVVLLLGVIGFVYYLGRPMNRVLGYIHFWVSYAALFVLFWMEYYNPAYLVKGYLDYHEYQGYRVVDTAYIVMALLLVAAQGLFVVNLVRMAIGKRR